eukprot:62374-Rhodomonas_salina.2
MCAAFTCRLCFPLAAGIVRAYVSLGRRIVDVQGVGENATMIPKTSSPALNLGFFGTESIVPAKSKPSSGMPYVSTKDPEGHS